jgi:NitT/TauT family transport system substrate-binding protein
VLRLWRKWIVAGLFLSIAVAPAGAAELKKLTIVVFGPPSLGAFLPPIIKAKKFDEKNGLAIEFVERPPDAYSVQFNSGEFQVGGSASLLTLGMADLRGVKVTYLFNLYDYWSYLVTSRPDVKTLKDLEGKDLAAAKGTSIYVMFDWFARQAGLDLSKVSVVNTASPGLMGYALADRAAAVHMWDPGYASIKLKKPDIRSIDLGIKKYWSDFTGGSKSIPYLGVAAHKEWADKNPDLVQKLYASYKDAVDWTLANPDEAARLTMAKSPVEEQKAVADLIRKNEELGLQIKWASDVRNELHAIYRAGREVGFLPGEPSDATIYTAPASVR